MKRRLLSVVLATISPAILAANLSISTTTNSRDFPLSADQPLVTHLGKDTFILKISDIEGSCKAPENQKVRFNKPIALNCGVATEIPFKVRFSSDYAFIYNEKAHTLTVKRQKNKSAKKEFKRPLPNVQCEKYAGSDVTIKLDGSYTDGTKLRDVYSDQIVTVTNNQVTIKPAAEKNGLVLLEPVKATEKSADLNWRNANIYFVMVDRFNNGDKSNDTNYGRRLDNKDNVGTFHGGDLKGVIEKLDYIQSLGTTAIWLSPIVEQMHGFVGGGESGSFPFYGYHGYWARDFTKLDANFGKEEDLKKLVDGAHKRGMKVLLDVVINHSGYSSLADLQFDNINVIKTPNDLPKKWGQWSPKAGQNWHSYHEYIDYKSPNWKKWWGADWVRTGLPGYTAPGSDDITMSLAGLPDFLTESDKKVTPPQWLLDNPGTQVVAKDDYTVSDYLIEWQTDWVKRFGIDGYRVDTVKHVEGDVWKRLKAQATKSLDQWRDEHGKAGQPFFMMGEVWAHGPLRSPYFDDGFDALINFDMQKKMNTGAACLSQMQSTYNNYSKELQEQSDFNPVSYMSSHDTELFFNRYKSIQMQKGAASALLLSPGAIQIYYGDEIGRKIGPYADDFHQGTRSDMMWKLDPERQELLKHWQKIGQFRNNHPAVGAGTHKEIPQENAYVFSRTLGNDKVIVAYLGK